MKFTLNFFYNIGVIWENLEFPHFCLDFLQKKFYNIDPRSCDSSFNELGKARVHLQPKKLSLAELGLDVHNRRSYF